MTEEETREYSRLPYPVRMVRIIEQTIRTILETGTATASISSAGGSKSYSHIDIPSLERQLKYWLRRAQGVKSPMFVKPNFSEVR